MARTNKPKSESPSQRDGGHRPHQGDVQQHDGDDHGHQGRHAVLGQCRDTSGFKGSRKSTPFAGQCAAQQAAEKATKFGVQGTWTCASRGPVPAAKARSPRCRRPGLTVKIDRRRARRFRTTAAARQEAARVVARSCPATAPCRENADFGGITDAYSMAWVGVAQRGSTCDASACHRDVRQVRGRAVRSAVSAQPLATACGASCSPA